MEFLTREERSRRLLLVHGIPFAQPVSPPPAVPYAAYAVQRALRREGTTRHPRVPESVLLATIAAPTTPAVYAALVRASALRRRCTRRQLGTLPTDVWNVPTTSRPGDNYRALAEPIVTRTTRSRTLRVPLRVPEQLPLASPEQADLPAYAAPRVHRRHGWRELQQLEQIDRYPQSPTIGSAPWAATQSVVARRRKDRQGLFLAAGDVSLARVTAQYPSYVLRGFFRREGLHRRLLRTITTRHQQAEPAPEQPLTAWLAPCVNRRRADTRLRTVAQINEFPATPPVPEQPVSAWAEPQGFMREGWRVRRDLPAHEVFSLTPGLAEAPFPGWIPPKVHHHRGWRALRTVERMPESVRLPAGHQPYGAWLAHEVTRRHGWRALRSFDGVDDFAQLQAFPGTPHDQLISVASRSKTIAVPVRSTTITVN